MCKNLPSSHEASSLIANALLSISFLQTQKSHRQQTKQRGIFVCLLEEKIPKLNSFQVNLLRSDSQDLLKSIAVRHRLQHPARTCGNEHSAELTSMHLFPHFADNQSLQIPIMYSDIEIKTSALGLEKQYLHTL